LVTRDLPITDASLGQAPQVRVGPGAATLMLFEQPIKEHGATLVDIHDLFLPVQTTERSVILVPKREVPEEWATTLAVTLSDGT
jgi:hypothetical protein